MPGRIITRDELIAATPPKHDTAIHWHARAYVERYSVDQTTYADNLIRSERLCTPAEIKRSGSGSRYNGLLADILHKMDAPEDGGVESLGNLLTTVGLTAITSLLIGVTPSAKLYPLGPVSGTNLHAACGVGTNGGTIGSGPAVGDTALVGDGTANALYQAQDGSFPTVSAGVMTGQTTFASGDANFAWNAWCWVAGNAAGSITKGNAIAAIMTTNTTTFAMWNHKAPASSLGTKASGAAWVFTTTITLS